MSKKKKLLEAEEQLDSGQLNQASVLDSLALGISKLGNGKWGLVEIAFNANTGESDVQDVTEFASRALASERFKIVAAKKIKI